MKDGGGGLSSEKLSLAESSQLKKEGIHHKADSNTTTNVFKEMMKSDRIQSKHANITSQPMATTTSASSTSDRSARELTSAVTTTASPYGTRSRNRTGGARPNYAEDRDVETDGELNGLVEHSVPKRRSPPNEKKASNTHQAPDRVFTGVSTRRASAALEHGSNTKNASAVTSGSTKEPIPGTSTFSANPRAGSPPPKKRKVAGAEKASTGHSTNTVSGGHTSTRKASTALAPAITVKSSNMLTFGNSQKYLKNGKLKADDGTTLKVNDHVYLICEPPGEPYYLARIMEFLHADNQPHNPIDSIRVNWYYRPRDINRKVTDTRVVFATMHSDLCPLTSLRGTCRIQHRSEIEDIDEYRKAKDCFWYEKLFDRYIHRYYDVIPVSQVINVPVNVKKVLDERWKFLVVEVGRSKELTSAVKSCKRCAGYCASDNSVECAVCRSTYHMNCVRPPLLKKPSRGFAWACGPCSRAQERKLEARNTPLISGQLEPEDEELFEEEEDDAAGRANADGSEDKDNSIRPATAEQSAHAKLWPYRYLGQHCRVEDALDYDDRIYPRASSRLGTRHQAVVSIWPGRPIEYVKPVDVKKKYAKGGNNKKDSKLSKDAAAALEADRIAKVKRPKWVLDEPPGYVPRGEDRDDDLPDCTAKALSKLPDADEGISKSSSLPSGSEEREDFLDRYISQVKDLAGEIGVQSHSTNLLDKALEILYQNKYNMEASLNAVRKLDKRNDLKEPDLNKEEQKRFEEGVSKFGSELHSITRHVRTVKHADIVRYYYVWKKTDKGRQIWGNYEGRRGKKEAKRADGAKLVDDVADDEDDSAFDDEKASKRKKGFECKFCRSRTSRQWRRAPGAAPGTIIPIDGSTKGNSKDKGYQFLVALCRRCAELWRRYGIQWEDIDEVAKKVAQGGGKAWKRKIDEELLKELVSTSYAPAIKTNHIAATTSVSARMSSASPVTNPLPPEPPKKKRKITPDKESGDNNTRTSPVRSITAAPENQKKKEKVTEKASTPAPPPVPEPPKPKVMPCAICDQKEPVGDQHLSCRECRLTVHRNCYGVVGDVRNATKWVCDMCVNDKNPQVSTSYQCVLCPVQYTEHDFVEPPKAVYRKRSEKERERERIDRESAIAAAEFFRRKQEEMNRPVNPREPLKRTAGNNWVHVTCAVWTPEMKFGNAKALEPSEGVGTIPSVRYEQICKVCKTNEGACVPCHQCHAPVHVACAHNAGYTLGFDITPVKGSRRELVTTVTLGSETGLMSAVIWCKEHAVKTIIHPVHERTEDSGLNALQVYVRNYKQADLTLTGTVRKANLLTQSTKMIAQNHVTPAGNRRASTTTGVNGVTPVGAQENTGSDKPEDDTELTDGRTDEQVNNTIKEMRCMMCQNEVTPKWWKGDYILPSTILVPGKMTDCSCHSNSGTSSDLSTELQTKLESGGHLPGCPMDKPVYSCVQERDMRKFEYGVPLSLYVVHDPNKMDEAARTIAGQPSYEVKAFFLCHQCHWDVLRDPHHFPFDEILRFTRPSERAAWIAGNMKQPSDSLDGCKSHAVSQTLGLTNENPASHLSPPLEITNDNPISHPADGLPHGNQYSPIRHLSQPLGIANENSINHPAEGLPHGNQYSPMMTHMNGFASTQPINEIHREPDRNSGLLLTHQLNGSPRAHFRHNSGPPQLVPAISHSQQTPTIPPSLLVPATVDNVYPHHHTHIPPPSHHLPPTNIQLRDNPPPPPPPPPPMVRDHRPSTPRESTSGPLGTMSRTAENEGRSAGGASASPSLRNLLS